MKTLYLIRHGQTFFNAKKRMQGFVDSPLTELGISQAKNTAQYLIDNNIKFDKAYCSTSERASSTLEFLTNQEYIRLRALKEQNFGTLDGEPESITAHIKDAYAFDSTYFTQFQGESTKEVRDRVFNALNTIMQDKDNKKVLVVSHGCAIRYFCDLFVEDKLKNQLHIGNCDIVKFHFIDNKFIFQEIINF